MGRNHMPPSMSAQGLLIVMSLLQGDLGELLEACHTQTLVAPEPLPTADGPSCSSQCCCCPAHLHERCTRRRVCCIQDCAIHKHDTHVLQRVVGVLADAAAPACAQRCTLSFIAPVNPCPLPQLHLLHSNTDPLSWLPCDMLAIFNQGCVLHLQIHCCAMLAKHIHARGVVGNDASNHARVDGGWVWADLVLNRQLVLASMSCQDAVDLSSNQAWLHSDRATITLPRHDNKDRVKLGSSLAA